MGASVSAGSVAPPASNFVFTPSKTTPDFETGKRHDPHYGFPEDMQRKERGETNIWDTLRLEGIRLFN